MFQQKTLHLRDKRIIFKKIYNALIVIMYLQCTNKDAFGTWCYFASKLCIENAAIFRNAFLVNKGQLSEHATKVPPPPGGQTPQPAVTLLPRDRDTLNLPLSLPISLFLLCLLDTNLPASSCTFYCCQCLCYLRPSSPCPLPLPFPTPKNSLRGVLSYH